MPRRSVTAVVGFLLTTTVALGLTSCGHKSSGLGRLTVDGQVQVASAHAAMRAAHSGEILSVGDSVQVTAGGAAIRLLPSGVLELRAGTQLTIGKTIHLVSGAVLIEPAGRAVQVSAQQATLVVPAGAAELKVGSVKDGLTAKVYHETAHLEIPGNPPAPIAAPRQISLTPETRLPVQASPLQYQSADPWDHMYLAEAEMISTQLSAAATGFNTQVPANQGKEAAFYQQLLPTLAGQADFVTAFGAVEKAQPAGGSAAAKPGDYLIASVIALRGTRGSFENRLSGGLMFSAQGAPWGFVAYDQGVEDLNGVLSDVLAGIGRASLPVTGAPASQIALGPPSTATTPTTRAGRPAPTTTTTTIFSTRPRPPITTTTTTTPAPPLLQLPVPLLPGPLGSLLNPLLDPLIQALNNLLAGRG